MSLKAGKILDMTCSPISNSSFEARSSSETCQNMYILDMFCIWICIVLVDLECALSCPCNNN
uniref:Uncharacterized protein n=1 Tax=Arundo donax TaxID=35708 RepID=A0A0A9DU91_ARUDO